MPKPFSSLSPSIEQRLAGWEQIQYRLSHAPAPKLRPTITLSRQFGCEAFPLSEDLKTRMEKLSGEPWNIYDKSLIEKVAHDEGIAPNLLEGLGDTARALEALGLNASTHVSQDAAFGKIAKAIIHLGMVGNAIIVGRGSAILCRDLPNCFHFRLEASVPWRVASIMKRLEVDEAEAKDLVKTNTRLREKFISQHLGEDISLLKHYAAIFNNERQSTHAMGAAIVAYVQAAWKDKSYFTHG